MDARWYSPAQGQFTSADTVDNPATPNIDNANPYAYDSGSPLDGTDPSRHYEAVCEDACPSGMLNGAAGGVGGGGLQIGGGALTGILSFGLFAAAIWSAFSNGSASGNSQPGSSGTSTYTAPEQRRFHQAFNGELTFGGADEAGLSGGGGGGSTYQPDICDSACQAARAAAQAAFAAAASKMGKVISKVAATIGTDPVTWPGAASKTTTIAHTGPTTNDGTAGGAGSTAGTSGYWLDANGNYFSMTDGTAYCGNGNSVDCELVGATDPYASLTTWSNLEPNDTIYQDVQILSFRDLKSATGKFAYVVMPDGEIRATRLGGKWGHVDLANGEDVIAAGKLKLYSGYVKDIDNRSGHYQPVGLDPLTAVELAFGAVGIDITGNIRRVGSSPVMEVWHVGVRASRNLEAGV